MFLVTVIASSMLFPTNYMVIALDQVLSNPELYKNFLVNENIDKLPSTLSEDKEWADNHAIQATADAFGLID